MPEWIVYVLIGLGAGITSGMFGIGGGTLIVPALIYCAGFTAHKATGTSLAVLLPPIGLAATIEYARHGNVSWKAAIIIAVTLFCSAFLGAFLANKISGPHLRLSFGVFTTLMGVYMIYGACKRLGWI
jgi:uncharacterized membrane protein YfcA